MLATVIVPKYPNVVNREKLADQVCPIKARPLNLYTVHVRINQK